MNSALLFPASILAAVAAFLIGALITPIVRDLATHMRVVDRAGSFRKVHTHPIPRLGGIAILIAWWSALCAAVATFPAFRAEFGHQELRWFALIGGCIAAAALGTFDDVRGLRARYKLLGQLLIALGLCAAGFTIHVIEVPIGVEIHLGGLAVPFTALWIAGVMNAVNLVDGLDGLAGGVAAIAAAALVVLAAASGQVVLAVLSAALAGALIAFLLYNRHPASIFMGDAGSHFLGCFLAVALPLAGRRPGSGVIPFAVPLLVLALPVTDVLLAIGRRALRGQGLFSPDRQHVHHRVLALAGSQRRAVAILWGASLLLALAGVALALGGRAVHAIVLVAVAGSGGWALRHVGALELPLKALRRERRRNAELQAAVETLSERLHRASEIADLFDSIDALAPVVEAHHVITRLGTAIVGQRPVPPTAGGALRMRFPIVAERRRVGDVVVVWNDGRDKVDVDHARTIEILCERLSRAVERVSPEIIDDAIPTPVSVSPLPPRIVKN